uniref:Uncharacterized protein n=1 Tax=Lepeophtheirus salmonis TaxID=72036 RepID=A0A0K2TMN1_LEPSM
MMTSFGQLIH